MDFNKFCRREWETCNTKTKGMKGWHLPGGQISLNKSNDILNLSVVFSSTITKNLIFMLFFGYTYIYIHFYMYWLNVVYFLYVIGKTKKILPCTMTFEFFLIVVLLLTKKQFLNNYNFSYLSIPLSAMILRTMFKNKISHQLIKILNWIFHSFNQNLMKIFKGIIFKKSRVIHTWVHTLDMLQCTD